MELSYARDSAVHPRPVPGFGRRLRGLSEMSGSVRVALSGRQLRVLVRAAREALAGDLLRASEVGDAYEVLELLDSKLPEAAERHPVGAVTGRLLFREEILRLLAADEDAGLSVVTLWEVDDRLTDKPLGTSIRRVAVSRASTSKQRLRSEPRGWGCLESTGGRRPRRWRGRSALRLLVRERLRSISNAPCSSIEWRFHQDALGALGQRSASERALEFVEFGKRVQHDVGRALPVL